MISFNCIVVVMSMAVPRTLISTLVYALYPLTRSNSVWVTSCNRMSITCLWRNSVRIGILIIADMPLMIMVLFYVSTSRLETEGKIKKFFLYRSKRGFRSAPNSIFGPIPFPLSPSF